MLIHGPRQCGKSTLALNVAGERFEGRHVTLDEPLVSDLARRDPNAFFNAHPAPLFIDEIQRAPELFLPLKLRVDRDRRPGQYLLTGSANVLALPKMADSLAGRMEVVNLWPFSLGEIVGSGDGFVDAVFGSQFRPEDYELDFDALIEQLATGGFPEPVSKASAPRRQAWFESYIRTILDRDVRDLAQIEALAQMPLLLSHLAARVGMPLNVSGVSADIQLPHTSLKRYLSLLETVFLLRPVPAWSIGASKALAKAPKMYLVDTGLLCHLLNASPSVLARDAVRLRRVLENFIAVELAKQCSFGEVRPWLMHLRTVRHLQVDFVLEARGGDVVGVQVVPEPTVKAVDADGLRFLRELAGERFVRGVVFYLGDVVQVLDDRITAVPIGNLWA